MGSNHDKTDDRSEAAIGLSRRDYIKGLGVAAAAPTTAATSYTAYQELKQAMEDEGILDELGEVVWRNGFFPVDGWKILSGFTREDLNNWFENYLRVRNSLFEGKVSSFQSYSPDVAGLSHPGDNTVLRLDGLGRVSGFMENGKEKIPFEPTRTINKDEGIFAGIKDDDTRWLPFEASIDWNRPGPGSLETEYTLDDLQITQKAQIMPGEKAGELKYEILNNSSETYEGEFLLYGKASANQKNQNPVLFKSEGNKLTTHLDSVTWDSQESKASFSMIPEAEISDSGVIRPETEDFYKRYIDIDIEEVVDTVAEAGSDELSNENALLNTLIESGVDLSKDALLRFLIEELKDNSDFEPDEETSVFDRIFEEAKEETDARYGSGYVSNEISLEPGESQELTFHLNNKPGSKKADWDFEVNNLEEELLANTLMHVNEAGVQAAHNLQPYYYPIWVRDSVFTYDALIDVDKGEHAKKFYTEKLPQIQRNDGSFPQCVYPDGENAGIWYSELDQPGILATKFPKADDYFDDELWEDSAAQTTYLASLQRIIENLEEGQLKASPDFAELPSHFFKQSLWTSGWAYQGLKNAKENYDSIKVDLSDKDDAPDILWENSENGFYSLEEEFIDDKLEELRDNTKEKYLEDELITNDGLLSDGFNGLGIYAKIVRETDILSDIDEEYGTDYEDMMVDKWMEGDPREGSSWTPSTGAKGMLALEKGRDPTKFREAIEDSFTRTRRLPERPKPGGWSDAMELAWGSAEALRFLYNDPERDMDYSWVE